MGNILKSHKKRIILFIAICLFYSGFSFAYNERAYKSATEYDYPPFSVVSNGEADGFSVALLKAVAKEMNLNITFKVDHWHIIKDELRTGQLDVLPLVGYSEEREAYFDFTVPYIVMQGNIFVRKDNTIIESEEDLVGKEIIVMRGDNSHEYVKAMGITENIILVDTYAEAFELLSRGHHDAVLAQNLVGHKLINDLDLENIKAVTKLAADGISRSKVTLEGYEQKFSFAVKEGNKELLAKLNEGLAIVSENGVYEELYLEWFPFLNTQEVDYARIIRMFIIALFGVVILALSISFYLVKKEVKRQTAALEDNLFRNTVIFEVMTKEYDSISHWLDYVLNEIIKITSSTFGYIYLVDEEKRKLTLNSWSKGVMKECLIARKETAYDLESTGIWGEVVRQRKPMILNDFDSDHPLKKGYPKGHVEIKNWMGIPIFEGNKIIATIGLANKETDYNDNDIFQVTTLMNGVWNMIQRFKYRNKLEYEKNKYLSTLVSIADGVMVIGINGSIEIMNKACTHLTGWDESEVVGTHYTHVINFLDKESDETYIDPVENVFQTRKKQQASRQRVQMVKSKKEYLIENSASPIKDHNNQMIGVVLVIRDVTKETKQKKLIEYLSFHDVLTELYNRRFFEEEMQRLDTQRNYPLTIIMGDLNGLKLTNDAFGHLEGDKLLRQAADLFRRHLRSEDIAARWGGDEFAILMPKTTGKDAEKIVHRMNEEIKKIQNEKGILSIAFGWASKTNENTSLQEVFKLAEEYMYKRKVNQSQSVRSMTIETIVNTLYEKSPNEERHSHRVRKFAIKIAGALGLSQYEIDEISTLALLHDIGKIIIPKEILEKEGALNAKEFQEIKKHPAIGYRMLSTLNEFSNIAKGVLHHHERWDGTGYPEGIKGKNIPLQARIITIADAFDAMTSYRPYRPEGLSVKEAKNQLKIGSGKQFDPEIIQLILAKDSVLL